MLLADWLCEVKGEREKNIYSAAIIHWLSDEEGEKSEEKEIDADVMFFYIRLSLLFLLFDVHGLSRATTVYSAKRRCRSLPNFRRPSMKRNFRFSS